VESLEQRDGLFIICPKYNSLTSQKNQEYSTHTFHAIPMGKGEWTRRFFLGAENRLRLHVRGNRHARER
jgi:hypothetical protein